MLAQEGILADLTPYMERDNFDIDNIPKQLQSYMKWDDEILSTPYTVSTPVFYYNKALWGEEAPTSIEDLAEKAKQAVANNPGVKGFGTGIDVTFIQRPILQSMGSDGILSADGKAAGKSGNKAGCRSG